MDTPIGVKELPNRAGCGLRRINPVLFVGLLLSVVWAGADSVHAATGRLELHVVDKDTGRPIACRMHLWNDRGRPVQPRRAVGWGEHFLVDGTADLVLPLGQYTFLLERGPEYLQVTGRFVLNRFADDTKTVALRRIVDMAGEGWWAGDLSVRRPPREAEWIMRAEDLHFMALQTWWNDAREPSCPAEQLLPFDNDRVCRVFSGKWTKEDGSLHVLGLAKQPSVDETHSASLIEAAVGFRNLPGKPWIDVARPYNADLPALVAMGAVDSIALAYGNMQRTVTVAEETEGLARDRKRYPDMWGHARWGQEIYFHLLNCGIRIPPSAGSDAGIGPNPAGYNRMYVYHEGEFDAAAWFDGFRNGRVVVTNGPLMRPSVHGQPPGAVFRVTGSDPIDLEIGLSLSTRDPITYLDIIQDGQVVQSVRFEDYASTGRLPKVTFRRSGWFLLRAATDVKDTYRFAMSAPYFVEFEGGPTIHRRSAEFFLAWAESRLRELRQTPTAREVDLAAYEKAVVFWKDLVDRANAE
ncbi:hypothetical protein JCM19992_22510 [Thermostilla marina]